MKVILNNTGKQFNYDWIFRAISFQFNPGISHAILGPNGSGKSTLLQIIAGNLTPSEGEATYFYNEKKIPVEEIFNYISISAPYMELIEEFTLEEMIAFHIQFKPLISIISQEKVIDILGLRKSENKMLKYFSSGMKQRVKLALAVFSDVPFILLDEPITNLDAEGVNWYKNIVNDFCKGRTVIVCSNQEQEYDFCKERLFLVKN